MPRQVALLLASVRNMTCDMRVVLDTDVIRAGLQSATGASRLLLCAIAEGSLVPLVTVATVFEYEDVMLRPDSLAATGLTSEGTVRFLDEFIARAERVIVRRRIRPSIQDPSDEMFVEALLNGGGEAVVTFNRRDYFHADQRLASQGRTAIPVMSPGEALRRLAWRPTAITPFVFRRR
jgi:predicted nucleic acid-binding protein